MNVRERVAQQMLDHLDEEVGEVPIRQWVRQETGRPLRAYATGMKKKGWGGAIEIAVAAIIFDRHIEVYRRAHNEEEPRDDDAWIGPGNRRIRRILSVNEGAAQGRIAVLFEGGTHYNGMENSVTVEEPRADNLTQEKGEEDTQASSSGTVPGHKGDDGGKQWQLEGHGRWTRKVAVPAPLGASERRHPSCEQDDTANPADQIACAGTGNAKRAGEVVVGVEPKEAKRRRIRGKCKGQ